MAKRCNAQTLDRKQWVNEARIMRSSIIAARPSRLHFSRSNFRPLKNSLQHLHQQQRRKVPGVVSNQQNQRILTVIQYPASNQVKTTNQDKTSKCNSLSTCYGKEAVAFTFLVNDGRFHSTRSSIAEVARKIRDTTTHEIDDAGSKASSVTLQLNHWICDKADSMVRHFLPANHPQSVAAGYDRFALASFLASIAGSAGMVLSTQVGSLHGATKKIINMLEMFWHKFPTANAPSHLTKTTVNHQR